MPSKCFCVRPVFGQPGRVMRVLQRAVHAAKLWACWFSFGDLHAFSTFMPLLRHPGLFSRWVSPASSHLVAAAGRVLAFLAMSVRLITPWNCLVGVLVCGVVLPPVLYYSLNSEQESRSWTLSRRFRSASDADGSEGEEEGENAQFDALQLRDEIKELRRIAESVRRELAELDKQRRSMLENIDRLKRSGGDGNNAGHRKECPPVPECVFDERTQPAPVRVVVEGPRRHIAAAELFSELEPPGLNQAQRCSMSNCFDMSRCSLWSQFRVFVHRATAGAPSEVQRALENAVKHGGYWTDRASEACLFVVLLPSRTSSDSSKLEDTLKSLPHWSGDGRNHLLFEHVNETETGVLSAVSGIGRAMVASSSAAFKARDGFDVRTPSWVVPADGETWPGMPAMLPAFRKNLVHFYGHPHELEVTAVLHAAELENLRKNGGENYDIRTSCGDRPTRVGSKGEWGLCGSTHDRKTALSVSTFALVPDVSLGTRPCGTLSVRLMEALLSGAVPVVLQTRTALPFDEVIEWRRAAVLVPAARWPELHHILLGLAREDILAMRLQGRFLLDAYFGTAAQIMLTSINVVRRRLGMPAAPLQSSQAGFHFSSDGGSSYKEARSAAFKQNFTLDTIGRWNNPPGANFHPPLSPFLPVLPSGWQFIGHGRENGPFHPVIQAGGSFWGETFRAFPGSIRPPERFTVVLLTYERPLVLVGAIQRLAGIAHLDRVVVVWNSPQPPSSDLAWPNIGVPVHVVKTKKNSLNNRFIPYEAIRTEAVLSLDDDTHLRSEEIDFAFRVWRENRDRIVGFPGRFHNWDARHGGWLYNSNYSCELSMVLTGAAFVHKYYFQLYTNHMPAAIRDVVDRFRNCEDLAMNCLVSHITRKPPIKVTLRWTFRCPGCDEALSEDQTHFTERHECLNEFAKVYGYMPLLYTQLRTDSVLFKTRLPHTMEKCYAYV